MDIRLLLAAALTAGAAHAADPGPCDDFYTWVNRDWLAKTELPPDRDRVGSFVELRIRNERLLAAALAELAVAPEPPASPGVRLVVDDYAAGMDEAAIARRGLGALAPLLVRIDAVRAPEDLPPLLGALARVDVDAPMDVYVNADAGDRRRHAVYVGQSGLGLPDRDDYLRDDERSQRLRSAYRAYARALLQGAGAAADDATLDALMAFERRLAEASSTRVQLRDPVARYNPRSVATLAEGAPGLDWRAWLQAYAGRADARLVVSVPAFAAAVARLATEVPAATWRSYLRVRLLDRWAPRLPAAFERAHFEFHESAVRGVRQPRPRAERVLRALENDGVQEGLGELFVARAFSPKAQQRALAMVADIRAAMAARIERLDWMSTPTKTRALAKLAAMQTKIGAPAAFRGWQGLRFARDDHAGNGLRGTEWRTQERLDELDRPVDRARWFTSAHIVNAFAGSLNEIVFPAGVLQPPFFDGDADDAVNYGAIGAVIGHEITHHFDDGGRQFDEVGNLKDWWTAEDAAAYRQRADRVAALYDGYEPLPGQRLNGRQTLGENISDLSGVAIAYDGLQRALARAGEKAGDPAVQARRFFIANATIWRTLERPESVANQLRTGVHSPGAFRVRGPLSQFPPFAAAFSCKPGSPMAAADPIRLW